MITKSILVIRPDGAKEICFSNSYDDTEGFVKIAQFLQKKFGGIVVHKISVDIDLWEFDFQGIRLNLVGDGLDNRLVAFTSNAFPLLERIFEDVDNDAIEKTISIFHK